MVYQWLIMHKTRERYVSTANPICFGIYEFEGPQLPNPRTPLFYVNSIYRKRLQIWGTTSSPIHEPCFRNYYSEHLRIWRPQMTNPKMITWANCKSAQDTQLWLHPQRSEMLHYGSSTLRTFTFSHDLSEVAKKRLCCSLSPVRTFTFGCNLSEVRQQSLRYIWLVRKN